MSALLLQSACEVFKTGKSGWYLIYRENAIGSDRGTFAGTLELTRDAEGQAIVDGAPPALDEYTDADLFGPFTSTDLRLALQEQFERRQVFSIAAFNDVFRRSPNIQRVRHDQILYALRGGAKDRASLSEIADPRLLDDLVDADRVACIHMPGLTLYALPEGS